jgi:predicted metal-dependent phosphoesterase TrpH
MRADLHMHSYYSDGAHSPEQLMDMAKGLGIELLSITDHDVAINEAENAAAAKARGLNYIPGVEFTCYDGEQIHILGYNYNRTPAFNRKIDELTQGRETRNRKMLQNLEGLGIKLNEEQIDRNARGMYGTVHIVRQIVRQGYCDDYLWAMKKYFTEEGLAYAPDSRMSPDEAVRLIKSAGGIAVWAHPGYTKRMTEEQKETLLRRLITCGLDGIESHYFCHTERERELYSGWAKKYGLISTVGSDFHGEERREKMGVPEHHLSPAEVDFLCKKN